MNLIGDPEAAQIALNAGWTVTMVGSDARATKRGGHKDRKILHGTLREERLAGRSDVGS